MEPWEILYIFPGLQTIPLRSKEGCRGNILCTGKKKRTWEEWTGK